MSPEISSPEDISTFEEQTEFSWKCPVVLCDLEHAVLLPQLFL